MADQSVPSVPAEGNTRNPKKLDSPSAWWCFTLNNYTKKDLEDINSWEKKCSKIVYQSEIGEQGTPHIQGVFCFKDKIRLTGLKKLFPTAHFEKTKSTAHAIEYCRKDDTWDQKIRVEKGVPVKVRCITTLRPWQQNVLDDVLKEPNDRTIQWYIDEKGGTGKTALCRYLIMKHNAIYINGGKGSDILHVTAEALQKNYGCKIILFDFPRTLEGKVSYSAIESIKNGLFMSTKYEGGLVNINPPHVVIFANWEPDVQQLSADRWEIYDI